MEEGIWKSISGSEDFIDRSLGGGKLRGKCCHGSRVDSVGSEGRGRTW